METEPGQHERQQQLAEDSSTDIPVVRTNTPRPFSFEAYIAQNGQSVQSEQLGQQGYSRWQRVEGRGTNEMLAAFPHEAPAAPPVPEEVDEQEESTGNGVSVGATPLPLSPSGTVLEAAEQEFVWLFEYGIEMDNALLNSPQHLNNAALLYGPAVLKGYTLNFAVIETQMQKVVATIVPSSEAGAEVWGVVYRIPRRLIEGGEGGLSQLDRVHGATLPQKVYERVEVVVTEVYRGRELSCVTYIATPLPHVSVAYVTDALYLQRLLETVRKQKLPETYIQGLSVSRMNGIARTGLHSAAVEQNTEPLPVVEEQQHSHVQVTSSGQVQPGQSVEGISPAQSRVTGYVIFACFSGILLLASLLMALLSGSGFAGDAFSTKFAPLHVPWYVLLYGLMGGSSSCLVTLGRRYRRARKDLPVVAMIICCSRPFIGVVLGMLSYLLFNSGFFALSGGATQHVMVSSLLAVLAGFCEGWLFSNLAA